MKKLPLLIYTLLVSVLKILADVEEAVEPYILLKSRVTYKIQSTINPQIVSVLTGEI